MWKRADDRKIMAMRREGKNWRTIAEHFSCRRGQVYERYRNYSLFLDQPDKKWSKEEERELIEQMQIVGKDWVLLGELFGCSSNNVKNRVNSIIRRHAKKKTRKKLECGPYRRAPAEFLEGACFRCGRKH